MKIPPILSALLLSILSILIPGRIKLPALPQAQQAGQYSFAYNTESGTFSVGKNGVTLFADAFCCYHRDAGTVSSKDYETRRIDKETFPGSTVFTVTMEKRGLWELQQTFTFNESADSFTTKVTLSDSGNMVSTNYIAPLVIANGKLQNSAFRWEKVLEVPFDNDGWVEFQVKERGQNTVSYEVGTLFTPDNGSGLVLGSLEHTHWKSAVATSGKPGRITDLALYCGAVDPRQGAEPHGSVSGETVSSPEMFIGVFDNWKAGMNAFAKANTALQPKRKAVGTGVPFGWNSWGSVQDKLNYNTAVQMSDYIRDRLQPVWSKGGTDVYVNLDSWWDMLSDDELQRFVAHCHENGQKAGIYTGPFVMWWDDYGMSISHVPGTDNTVTYQDIRLKKHDGTFYGNEVDGCVPLDVTHPATKLHVQHQIDRFKAAGFDYIKLDFLVHASFEGDYYDKSIHTGIEAYNYAMQWLTAMIGDDIFINLAMSPIFPYQYANGRRLACDSYYGIGETQYTLNAVTYGFWEQELYDYTDPDHIVVWGKDAGACEAEARSRVTSGVISGTSFLAGDNFVSPAGDEAAAQQRFSLLTNEDVIAVAKKGKIFTPVITNTLHRTANIFRLESDGTTYIAVINYSAVPRTFAVRTGLGRFSGRELWRGKTVSGVDTLLVTLPSKDAAIYALTNG